MEKTILAERLIRELGWFLYSLSKYAAACRSSLLRIAIPFTGAFSLQGLFSIAGYCVPADSRGVSDRTQELSTEQSLFGLLKVSVRRTLTRTEDGNSIALGDPKTKRSGRTVRLTPGARDALKRHRTGQAEERLKVGSAYQDGDLVFATKCGTPINPSNLRNRSFAPLLKRAGLPQITFHDLRHTTASLLFSKNVHPKFVQELLGHASVAHTLDIYSHMLPGMGGEAADAMRESLG